MMNISSLVVHVRPEHQQDAVLAMQQLAGVEVHAQSDDGRLVVTVEETPAHRAADTVMDLHNVAGVLSAAVVYHHNEFETEEGSHETQ